MCIGLLIYTKVFQFSFITYVNFCFKKWQNNVFYAFNGQYLTHTFYDK